VKVTRHPHRTGSGGGTTGGLAATGGDVLLPIAGLSAIGAALLLRRRLQPSS